MQKKAEGSRETNVHVDFSGEEGAGRGMNQEDALEEIEGGDYQEIILAVWKTIN